MVEHDKSEGIWGIKPHQSIKIRYTAANYFPSLLLAISNFLSFDDVTQGEEKRKRERKESEGFCVGEGEGRQKRRKKKPLRLDGGNFLGAKEEKRRTPTLKREGKILCLLWENFVEMCVKHMVFASLTARALLRAMKMFSGVGLSRSFCRLFLALKT